MEKVAYSTRRKKRKTRKCLDEIRNRSRRKISGNSFEQSSQHFAKVCMLECKTNNHLVTMDRLTLKAMFPKAIRSETITRPALAEIKQKYSVHLADFVRDKQQRANKASIPLIDQETLCSNITIGTNFRKNMSLSDFEEDSLCKENSYKNDDHGVKSSSSFKLFSPSGPTVNTFTVNKLLNEEGAVNSTLTSSSQTSHGDYRRHLYEDLMNEIPAYFKRLTSTIIKEDVVKNTINSLKKLYVETCQKQYEDNVLKCINGHVRCNTSCSKNKTIVDNPLDYIRLVQGGQQSPVVGRRQAASAPLSSWPTPTGRPAAGAGAARSPASSPAALHVVLYDTPEYNYYPHRLN